MHLVLRAVTLGGATLTQTLSGRFDERGGTLGRSDDNTLTLPDPKRHISRLQAEVSPTHRGYSIRNVGSANPIIVNEHPVAPGECATLSDGDDLQIGAYRLQVCLMQDEESAGPITVAGVQSLDERLPSDFSFSATDRHADPWSQDPSELLRPVGASHSGSLEEWTGCDQPDDVLQRFLDGAMAGASPAPRRDAALPVASMPLPLPGAPCRADPVRLLMPSQHGAPEPLPAAAFIDRTPDVHAAMPLPRAAPAVCPPPAAVDIDVDDPTVSTPSVPLSATDAATNAELWQAFCEGTGVAFQPPQGLNAPLMRTIGQLLHHLAGGTVKLLRVRAETKHELRFPATMLRPHGNNPLRYSPNVQAALTQLLQPPLSGFMAGPEATQEAMDDLFAHAVGTMTGMRAAIEGVLRRFEPPRLEAQIAGAQVLDTLLPMHRRARLWDLYLQHFDAVRCEAHDDFHRLFGQAFVDAYEQQLDRLDAERRARRSAPR